MTRRCAVSLSLAARWLANLGYAVLVVVLAGSTALLSPASATANPGVDEVTVGAFINDIQQVDLVDGSFTMDLYLWMRWRGDRSDPTDSVEVMNSNTFENTTTSESGGVAGKPLFAAPRTMPDGSKYMAFRYQGVFSRKMDLEKFPFDVQNLVALFEDQDQDTTQLVYVPDKNPIAISPSVNIPGYEIGKPTLAVRAHQYPTNFGDLNASPEQKYSRIIIAVPVKRDVLPYMVKIMLPILIVILITALIYVMPARFEDSRTGIGVTAMLTMVALQWTTDEGLPSVEYLTLLDLIYILSMLYILAAMAYTVIASRRTRKETADAILTSFDRRVGVTSLLIYAVLIALALTFYLRHQYTDLLM